MAETKTRNIYEKMAAVKTKLLGIKKGGKNDFSHYSYFELGDILPVLTPALQEERLYMHTQFSATEQIAKLVIVDIDNTESKIEFEIRFAECNLKGAHEIQNLGAAQTYTRRYLIMTAFDIAEADIVDAGAEKDDKKTEPKKDKQTSAQKSQQETPLKKETEKPEAEEITKLKANAWELIKMLPGDQQTTWVNSCKGANKEALKQIINDLLKLTQEVSEQTPQGEPAKTAEMEIF
ncbi:MAG: ERF family protein [Treponema sp.]|jgi:hypothetical protein|nr:ERF family protein [Treponema sp.]